VDGQPVHIINVHLWPIGTLDRNQFARSLARQHVQAAELQRLAQQLDGPLLVVGDFNASPTNDTYTMLNERLDDTWREVGSGPGFTWPAPGVEAREGSPRPPFWIRPFLRIDYMWRNEAITPRDIQVLPAIAGSDHLPLLADFALDGVEGGE
jgi:endonuclease/exonuclease/phosphatase (EEP) superfamily protein YafD